jgi:hypothetical protein
MKIFTWWKMNKIYIVYIKPYNWRDWSNSGDGEAFEDIFYVSSLEKAKYFLEKAIAYNDYGLVPATKIMISETGIDKYDDNHSVAFEGNIREFLELKV